MCIIDGVGVHCSYSVAVGTSAPLWMELHVPLTGSIAATAVSAIRGWRALRVEVPKLGVTGMVLWKVVCCPVGHA